MLHSSFEGWNIQRFIRIQNIHLCTNTYTYVYIYILGLSDYRDSIHYRDT